MTANQDEDERRRIVVELKELVRGSRATSQAEDGPLAVAAYLVSEQEDQKIGLETHIRRSTSQQARDPINLRGFQSQKRGLHSDFVTTAELLAARRQKAVSAPAEAPRSDVLRDGNDESKNPLHEHENNFSDSVGMANVEVRSRRYLLLLAAIVVVFGLAGLAASIGFRSATSDLTETPTIRSESELAKLQPEGSTGADAPVQDASIIDTSPQPSPPMLVDKAEQSINASRAEEKAPSMVAPGGESATEVATPILPADAFSAIQAPPQAPATAAPLSLTRHVAPAPKGSKANPDQIANTQAGASASELISTPTTRKLEPVPPPRSAKGAPLPQSRRAAVAPTVQPAKAKAAGNAEQEQAAPTPIKAQTHWPPATPETSGPSEFIVQRALDALFKGPEDSDR